MSILELLKKMEEQDIVISASNGNLKINAPKGRITDDLKKELMEHKSELINRLNSGEGDKGIANTIQKSDQIGEEELNDHIRFWVDNLKDIPSETAFPIERSRPSAPSESSAVCTVTISKEKAGELISLAENMNVTLFSILTALYNVFLYRYSGQDDIVVGTPVPYTKLLELGNMTGNHNIMIPLRYHLRREMRFSVLLKGIEEGYQEAVQHSDVLFGKLLSHLELDRSSAGNPICQYGIALYSESERGADMAAMPVREFETAAGLSQFDMNWVFSYTGEDISLRIVYSTDLFSEQGVLGFAQNFLRLADDVIADADTKISELEIISDTERELLSEFNDTGHDFADKRSFQQWITEAGSEDPEGRALIFEGGSYTNGELYSRVDKLAACLQEKGVKPNDIIGIYTDRTPEMIVGILGILKAGAAYLPLDPKYPAEKKEFMVSDAGTELILTQEKYLKDLDAYEAEIISLDGDWETIGKTKKRYEIPEISDDDLAYVIYTSGSTGTPKGVLLTYGNLLSYSRMAIDEYDLTSEDTVLQFGTMNFDIFVEEVFPTYLSGGTLVLRDEASALGGDAFWSFIEEHKITFISLPTAFWHTLCTQLEEQHVKMGETVRLLVFGGEAMSEHMLELWQKAFGTSVRLINSYGPSETTVVVTGFDCEDYDTENGKVPIGTPFRNVKCYILDEDLNECPIGVRGELYISGPQVAKGYLNRPELTKEKFIKNPFFGNDHSIIYKTGDICNYMPDGNIAFVGRNDFQVKLRGLRIELGAIETAINRLESVMESVVIVREDTPGDKKLVAYLVPLVDNVKPQYLRDKLKKKLADYAIPSSFVLMDEIPRTVNGKIDKRALPVPERSDMAGQKNIVEPNTDTERKIRDIWENILNLSPVSVEDNFFDIGGHSLIAVQLFDELRYKFGVDLPLAALFEAPTIRQLSDLIGENDNVQQNVSSSPLVEINGAGDKVPFYCVHGHFGNVLNFATLSRELGGDQPFYGLQGIGITGKEVPLTRIEEIAERYMQEIKAVQPEGPYSIGGYCYGTLVALELANKLKEQGDKIAHLVMFDPQPDLYPELLNDDLIRRFEKLLNSQRVIIHKKELVRKSALQMTGYFFSKIINKVRTIFMTTGLKICDSICRMTSLKLPKIFRDVEFTNFLAMNKYTVMQPWEGDVHMVLSEKVVSGYSKDPSADWKDLATGMITIHYVDDNGLIAGGEMFKHPYVFTTAEKLGMILNSDFRESPEKESESR